MLQIVSFGQVFRLARGAQPVNEMRVVGPSGVEHGIEISQRILEDLLRVWTSISPSVASTVRPMEVMEEPAEAPDPGEIRAYEETVVKDGEVAPVKRTYPTKKALPVPKFVGQTPADDDGDQI